MAFNLIAIASNLIALADGLQPNSGDGLGTNSYALEPNSDGLQRPNSECLQPKRDGIQPHSNGPEPMRASNLT